MMIDLAAVILCCIKFIIYEWAIRLHDSLECHAVFHRGSPGEILSLQINVCIKPVLLCCLHIFHLCFDMFFNDISCKHFAFWYCWTIQQHVYSYAQTWMTYMLVLCSWYFSCRVNTVSSHAIAQLIIISVLWPFIAIHGISSAVS